MSCFETQQGKPGADILVGLWPEVSWRNAEGYIGVAFTPGSYGLAHHVTEDSLKQRGGRINAKREGMMVYLKCCAPSFAVRGKCV